MIDMKHLLPFHEFCDGDLCLTLRFGTCLMTLRVEWPIAMMHGHPWLMWMMPWCGRGIPVGLSGSSRWTGEHAIWAENLPPVAFWWGRGGGQCEGLL